VTRKKANDLNWVIDLPGFAERASAKPGTGIDLRSSIVAQIRSASA